MTIAHVASTGGTTTATTAVRGTSTIVVPFVGVGAGRIAIIVAEGKLSTATWGTDPAGFTKIADFTGGVGANGVDTGLVRMGIWYKVLTGSETGSVTVTLTGGTQLTAVMSTYSKTATTWLVPQAVTGQDNTSATNISGVLGAWPAPLYPGDMVVVGHASTTDGNGTAQLSVPTISQTSVTFGTVTYRNRMSGSDGNDGSVFTWDALVSAGSTVTAPTVGATWGVTGSGALAAVRLREVNSTAVSTLSENFNDNTINTAVWGQNYGVTSEVGGRARVETSTTYSAFMSLYQYSLDTNGLFMQVFPAAQNGATAEAYTAVWLTAGSQAAGTDFGFYYEPTTGVLNMTVRTAYTQDGATVNLAYNATDHAYWRIRLSGGNILWDTSPNGSTWTNRRTAVAATVAPYAATTVDFAIMMESHRANGTTNFAEFDNVNLAGLTAVTGDAGLTGQSNLVVSGLVTNLGSALLTGQSNLVALATVTRIASSVLTGQSNLVAVATTPKSGIALLTGQSTLTVAGTVGSVPKTGDAVLTGQSNLTVIGRATTSSTVLLTGQSNAVIVGRATVSGSALLTGQSSFTGTGIAARAGATVFSAQSSLTVAGSVASSGAALLTGQSTLFAIGATTRIGSALLTAESNLTVIGNRVISGSTLLTGQSSMDTVGSTLTTVGAVLTGHSNLTVVGKVTTTGAAILTGQSSLTALGTTPKNGTALLTSQSSLIAIASNNARAQSILTGQSNMTITASVSTTGSAVLTGQSNMVVAGVIGAVPVYVQLSGFSNAVISGTVTANAVAILSGQSSMMVSGSVTVKGSTLFTGQSNLVGNSVVTRFGIGALSGQSNMAVVGNTGIASVGVVLSGQSTMFVTAQVIRTGSANLSGQSSIATLGRVTTRGSAVLSSQSLITVIGTRIVRGTVTLTTQSNFQVSGFIPAVVTGLVQLSAELSIEIIGRTNPPWTSPFIEFSKSTVKGTDRLSDRVSNQKEITSSTKTFEGG